MEIVTTKELQQLKGDLISNFDQLFEKKYPADFIGQFKWLRSKAIRKLMDISPA